MAAVGIGIDGDVARFIEGVELQFVPSGSELDFDLPFIAVNMRPAVTKDHLGPFFNASTDDNNLVIRCDIDAGFDQLEGTEG